MDAQLWSRLPSELLDRVLSYLPVRDLLRCSTACKTWKQLISTPQFGRLCFRNSKALGRCYIVARSVVETQLDDTDFTLTGYLGWSVLDLETRRWNALKECDVLCSGLNRYGRRGATSMFRLVAADGGLVCEYREGVPLSRSVVEVFNPLTNRKRRVLPNLLQRVGVHPGHAMMSLVVDEVDNSFMVFFIELNLYSLRYSDPSGASVDRVIMHIYESTTNQWRSAANPLLQSIENGIGVYGSSIMFEGLLYVVFSSHYLWHYGLFAYNIKEDVWQDTDVYFDVCDMGSVVAPQLIVSDNRLFVISWNAPDPRKSRSCCRLQIEEVLLNTDPEPFLMMLFQMTGELVNLVFHLPEMGPGDREGRPWGWPHACPKIEAFGFDKSIMLMSRETGISIVYDLDLRVYSQMPTNPMEPIPPGCKLWYGQPMNLRLSSIPW